MPRWGDRVMRYLPLVWASLFHKKTRLILTLLSLTAAFMLFGLLQAYRRFTAYSLAPVVANAGTSNYIKMENSFVIIVKGADTVKALKGRSINLVELSVSHYLLARALDMNGLSEKDVTLVNTSDADIAANIAGIKQVFARFLTFGDGPTDAIMVDNDAWLSTFGYVQFLRDYGVHFTINKMLSLDSVKLRLDREQPLWQLSQHARTGSGQWLAEAVASFGLIAVIISTTRHRASATPFAVAEIGRASCRERVSSPV